MKTVAFENKLIGLLFFIVLLVFTAAEKDTKILDQLNSQLNRKSPTNISIKELKQLPLHDYAPSSLYSTVAFDEAGHPAHQ